MIKCLAHICIEAVDLKKAQWFYCDVLGFTKKFDFIKDGAQFGFYLQINESNFIEIFKAGENRGASQWPKIKHFCLEVEDIDIDAGEKQLTENGIKTRGKKMRYILAMAVHPWGYHIAIAKHGSTSSHPEGCSLI